MISSGSVPRSHWALPLRMALQHDLHGLVFAQFLAMLLRHDNPRYSFEPAVDPTSRNE